MRLPSIGNGTTRIVLASLVLTTGLVTACTPSDGKIGHAVDHVGNSTISSTHPTNQANSTGASVSSGALRTANDRLTLQRIQVVSNGVIFVLTHGDMLQVYENPHITGGRRPTFVVTLRNVDPGRYPLNHTTMVHSNWATDMTLSHVGPDLRAVFHLHPGIKTVTTAVGFGDTIQFMFR